MKAYRYLTRTAALLASLGLVGSSYGADFSSSLADVYNDAAVVQTSCDVCCDDACDSGCDNGCEAACGCENTGCDSGGCCDSGCDGIGGGLGDVLGGVSLGGCCLGDAWKLFDDPCCNGTDIGGHIQFGYHNKANPLASGSFNNRPDEVNLHQAWIYAGKAANGDCCGWDWGYRADFVYGIDAQDTQAFGGDNWDNDWDHGAYGWALPQLYAELDRGDLNVKIGHFFTPVGYEVIPATGNFFYSHSYTMYNSEPFTHTGVLATYQANCNLTLYGGYSLGWDTGFEDEMNGSTFIGGGTLSVSDDVSLTYIATAGNFGRRGDDAYSHSIVADVTLTENLNYVLQSDYVRVDSTQDDDVGINQYLFYTVNDCVAVGGRFEWWKNEGQSWYEATAGLNYKANANVVIRPEVRHDFSPATGFDQTSFGVDAIMTF